MPSDDDLYQLTLAWLTLAWHWVRGGRRAEAELFLGVDESCADALERIPITRLPALAGSGVITFRPRSPSSFWSFVAGTDDDDAVQRYMLLTAERVRFVGTANHP